MILKNPKFDMKITPKDSRSSSRKLMQEDKKRITLRLNEKEERMKANKAEIKAKKEMMGKMEVVENKILSEYVADEEDENASTISPKKENVSLRKATCKLNLHIEKQKKIQMNISKIKVNIANENECQGKLTEAAKIESSKEIKVPDLQDYIHQKSLIYKLRDQNSKDKMFIKSYETKLKTSSTNEIQATPPSNKLGFQQSTQISQNINNDHKTKSGKYLKLYFKSSRFSSKESKTNLSDAPSLYFKSSRFSSKESKTNLSDAPTRNPSRSPSIGPTRNPSRSSTNYQSLFPPISPTMISSRDPSSNPSSLPSRIPIQSPKHRLHPGLQTFHLKHGQYLLLKFQQFLLLILQEIYLLYHHRIKHKGSIHQCQQTASRPHCPPSDTTGTENSRRKSNSFNINDKFMTHHISTLHRCITLHYISYYMEHYIQQQSPATNVEKQIKDHQYGNLQTHQYGNIKVGLIYNPKTGYISPQFHTVHDDNFSCTSCRTTNKLPNNWDYLFDNHRELSPDEFEHPLGPQWETPSKPSQSSRSSKTKASVGAASNDIAPTVTIESSTSEGAASNDIVPTAAIEPSSPTAHNYKRSHEQTPFQREKQKGSNFSEGATTNSAREGEHNREQPITIRTRSGRLSIHPNRYNPTINNTFGLLTRQCASTVKNLLSTEMTNQIRNKIGHISMFKASLDYLEQINHNFDDNTNNLLDPRCFTASTATRNH